MLSSKHIKSRYNRKYYTIFAGWDRRLQEFVKHLPTLPVQIRILDVGCGPGDLVSYFTKLGYRAVGVDYSPAGIALAKKHPGKFLVMDATHLKFPDNSFDAVFSIEVAEHVNQPELTQSLKETKRVLAPGGILWLHTEPNRVFNDYFYPYWSYPVGSWLIWLNNKLGNHYPPMVKPGEIRSAINKKVHINEPTYFSLKEAFKKAQWSGKITSLNLVWNKPLLSWKDWVFNLLVYWQPISCIWPFNILAGQDFLVVAKK